MFADQVVEMHKVCGNTEATGALRTENLYQMSSITLLGNSYA